VSRTARVALGVLIAVGALESGIRIVRLGPGSAALGRFGVAPPWSALRTLDPAGDPVPRPGARVAWALAPRQPVVTYRLNRLGLREDRDLAPWPPPGVCRILALGDAYTFGYGVWARDTFPAALERRLRRHARVEVVNGGFPNVNVEQSRRRLATLLPALHPAMVVFTFSWWDVPADPAGAGGWLARHADALAERVTPWSGVATAGWRLVRHALTPLVFPPSGMARELEPLAAPPGAVAARWRRTAAAIAGMADDAARAGAGFLVVIAPLDLQVDARRNALYRWERLPYPSHGFVDRDYARGSAMPAALVEAARGGKIRVVDATPAFRARRARPLFLDGDYHAAPAGYRLLARVAAQAVGDAPPCRVASGAALTAR